MRKRSSKPTAEDVNQSAFRTVQQITRDDADVAPAPAPAPTAKKNPAAVALGRLGGQKGGKARAATLSASQRSDIARTAANKRWATRKPDR